MRDKNLFLSKNRARPTLCLGLSTVIVQIGAENCKKKFQIPLELTGSLSPTRSDFVTKCSLEKLGWSVLPDAGNIINMCICLDAMRGTDEIYVTQLRLLRACRHAIKCCTANGDLKRTVFLFPAERTSWTKGSKECWVLAAATGYRRSCRLDGLSQKGTVAP